MTFQSDMRRAWGKNKQAYMTLGTLFQFRIRIMEDDAKSNHGWVPNEWVTK